LLIGELRREEEEEGGGRNTLCPPPLHWCFALLSIILMLHPLSSSYYYYYDHYDHYDHHYRFDFRMDEDILASSGDVELQKALLEKVSRERVGIELEGMLSGKDAR